MTDHWKDVQPIYPFSESPHCDDGPACYFADSVDAARAKDAAERAEREAAYEARVQRDHDEIVELTAEIARLTQEVTTLRAREAKLREALKDVLPQAIHSRHCALRPCRCPIKTARAVLAEGEDTRD